MRHALILAGGSGTRLWPMSRQGRPKQLVPVLRGQSLLEMAYDRLDGLVPTERRSICAGVDHRAPIIAALPELPEDRYIAEPTGRDTLPALAYSTALIAADDPEAVIAVFSADHIITPEPRFREIIAAGFELVDNDRRRFVTFGITPDRPATSFGYLELGSAVGTSAGKPARALTAFREKPDEKTATAYFEEGPERYLWNSGMFVWAATSFLDAVGRFKPEMHQQIETIVEAYRNRASEAEFASYLETAYPALEKISVDFGIMEPASRDESTPIVAVPMDLTWKDIGSWPAFAETIEADESDNRVEGTAELLDSSATLVVNESSDHLVAGIGLDDMIIIHTDGATLVCPKDRAEEIKQLHARIGKQFGGKFL